MVESKCIKLEDDLEYVVIDEISDGDGITYVYLANTNDEKDFCIRKVDDRKDSELLVGLDSNIEFDKALLIFTKKHNK